MPFVDKPHGFEASAHHTVGWGSVSEGGAKISQWENRSGFNVGLRWQF